MVEQNGSTEILKNQIVEQSQSEAHEILNQAKKEAESIRNQARTAAEKIHDEILKKAEGQAEAIRKRLLSGVHLEVKRKKLQTREHILRDVFQDVQARFETFRTSDRYAATLQDWIIEGVLALNEDHVLLVVDKSEEQLLKKVIEAVKVRLKKEHQVTATLHIKPEPGTEGGVLVTSQDGRTRFDNRFSARMRRFEDVMRIEAMRIVFGE